MCFQDVYEKIVPQRYLRQETYLVGNEEELAALHRSSAPEMPEQDELKLE